MPEEKSKPIGPGSVIGMLILAVSLDMSTLLFNILYVAIPFVGWIIAAIAGLLFQMIGFVIFSLWFSFKGVKFLGKIGPAAIIEFIPVVNTLPAWTVAVGLTIMTANGSVFFQKILGIVGLAGVTQAATLSKKSQFPVQQKPPGGPEEGVQEEPEPPQGERPARSNLVNMTDIKAGRQTPPQQTRRPPSENLEEVA